MSSSGDSEAPYYSDQEDEETFGGNSESPSREEDQAGELSLPQRMQSSFSSSSRISCAGESSCCCVDKEKCDMCLVVVRRLPVEGQSMSQPQPISSRMLYGLIDIEPTILAQVPGFRPVGSRKRIQSVIEQILFRHEQSLGGEEDDIEFGLDDLGSGGWNSKAFSVPTTIKKAIEEIILKKDPDETFRESPYEASVPLQSLKIPDIKEEVEEEEEDFCEIVWDKGAYCNFEERLYSGCEDATIAYETTLDVKSEVVETPNVDTRENLGVSDIEESCKVDQCRSLPASTFNDNFRPFCFKSTANNKYVPGYYGVTDLWPTSLAGKTALGSKTSKSCNINSKITLPPPRKFFSGTQTNFFVAQKLAQNVQLVPLHPSRNIMK